MEIFVAVCSVVTGNDGFQWQQQFVTAPSQGLAYMHTAAKVQTGPTELNISILQ